MSWFSSPSASRSQSVSHRELVKAGALLLDVRTPDEYAQGHVPGARNLPVHELPARLGELMQDQHVVVYCRSGARSASARAILTHAGFAVTDIGSIANW